MQLISLCPLAASTLLWRTPNGPCLTIAVKATFQLSPDNVAAVAAPLPLFHDVFHEQNVGRSLYVASDAVPHKPRADVLLTGSAYAPPGQRVNVKAARFTGAVLELAAAASARCEDAVFEGARAPGASFAGGRSSGRASIARTSPARR